MVTTANLFELAKQEILAHHKLADSLLAVCRPSEYQGKKEKNVLIKGIQESCFSHLQSQMSILVPSCFAMKKIVKKVLRLPLEIKQLDKLEELLSSTHKVLEQCSDQLHKIDRLSKENLLSKKWGCGDLQEFIKKISCLAFEEGKLLENIVKEKERVYSKSLYSSKPSFFDEWWANYCLDPALVQEGYCFLRILKKIQMRSSPLEAYDVKFLYQLKKEVKVEKAIPFELVERLRKLESFSKRTLQLVLDFNFCLKELVDVIPSSIKDSFIDSTDEKRYKQEPSLFSTSFLNQFNLFPFRNEIILFEGGRLHSLIKEFGQWLIHYLEEDESELPQGMHDLLRFICKRSFQHQWEEDFKEIVFIKEILSNELGEISSQLSYRQELCQSLLQILQLFKEESSSLKYNKVVELHHVISRLNRFLVHIPVKEQEHFERLLDSLLEEYEQTIQSKLLLIEEVHKEYEKTKKTEDDEMFFAVQLYQIVYNPFEMLLAPKLLEPSLDQTTLKLSLLENQKLVSSDLILKAKQTALQRIYKFKRRQKNENPPLLIAGAGPAGLVSAFGFLIKGLSVILLEKRKENSQRRKNVIILGGDGIGNSDILGFKKTPDLYILKFLGVLDDLILQEKVYVSPLNSNAVIVEIGSLEEAILRQLNHLTSQDSSFSLIYEAQIVALKPGQKETDKATIIYQTCHSLSRKPICHSAHVEACLIAEGYKSSTRDLLGGRIIKLSKSSKAVFALFKVLESYSKGDSLNLLAKAWILLQKAQTYLSKTKKARELLPPTKIPTAQASQRQYLYKILDDSESRLIKIKLKSLEFLRARQKEASSQLQKVLEGSSIEVYEESDIVRFRKAGSSMQLKDHLQKIQKDEEDRNKIHQEIAEIAFKNIHHDPILKKGSTTFSEPMKLNEDIGVATTQITRASSIFYRVGETVIHIMGDAGSTTDPLSGAGMRTTFLRSIPIVHFFSSSKQRNNPFAEACFKRFIDLSNLAMREEGWSELEKSHQLPKARIERYLDIALICRVLKEDEIDHLFSLYIKKEWVQEDSKVLFTEKEIQEITLWQQNLRTKYLVATLQDHIQFPVGEGRYNAILERCRASQKEQELFRNIMKAIHQGNGIYLDHESKQTLQSLCSKLPLYYNSLLTWGNYKQLYLPEAWFIPLWTSLSICKK